MDNTTLNKTLFNVPEHDFLYLIQGLEAKKAKANKVKIK